MSLFSSPLPPFSPTPPAPSGPDPRDQAAAAAEQRRRRARFGTIATSFRGLLTPPELLQRKNLLGE